MGLIFAGSYSHQSGKELCDRASGFPTIAVLMFGLGDEVFQPGIHFQRGFDTDAAGAVIPRRIHFFRQKYNLPDIPAVFGGWVFLVCHDDCKERCA